MQSTQNELLQFQHLQLSLKSEIAALNLPPLGPDFKSLDKQSASDALIAYRLTKKLSKVDVDVTRAEKSVRDMLHYDENGLTSFNPSKLELDPYIRQHIYQSRLVFQETLRNFKIDYQSFDFPSGESFDSSRGDVSLYSKLKNNKHWKVTQSCRLHFAKLIYHNLWFKRIAMDKVRQHPFYIKHKTAIDKHLWEKHKTSHNAAFDIFYEKMREFVFTLEIGARLATVPKDNDKDRVIEIECLGNMCVQRAIAHSFRNVIEKHYGYDLQMAQLIHQQMISDFSNATIDFSNASNSNWKSLLEFFFPKKVYQLLCDARSSVVCYSGEYYGLNMIAPMGNGFTFEVMSFFLLTLARGFDSLASVFGDDVIIDRDTSPAFVELMTCLGWKINETKSFIDGNFRESCGSFKHKDAYLTSYDFWLATDVCDMMICTNKIFVLLKSTYDPRLTLVLKKFWYQAIKLLPSRSLRIAKQSLVHEPEKVYEYTLKNPAKVKSLLGYKYKKLVTNMIIPSSEKYPLEKGVLVDRKTYEARTKICTETENKRYKKLQRKAQVEAQKYNYTKFRICEYPVRDLVDHVRRAPITNVRNKVWLGTYYRFNRVVQPKSGISIIKWKTILITGIDIEI